MKIFATFTTFAASTTVTTFAVLAFVLATSPTPARASDAVPANSPAVQACKKDMETLCPGVQMGEGRMLACLKEHRRKLSEGCKAAVKAQRGAVKDAKPAG